MKTNHTPGPWKAELITAGDKPAHPVYWNIKFSGDYDSHRAAINVYKAGKGTIKEAEANARLIAAAPELLEALGNLYKAAEKFYNEKDQAFTDVLHAAYIAINKARFPMPTPTENDLE
jgi:hypothetical protein